MHNSLSKDNYTQMIHIIWTTYPGYLPNDTRGDWNDLLMLYSSETKIKLCKKYNYTGYPKDKLLLNDCAIKQLTNDIYELTKINGDRLANHTKIFELHISNHCVNMIAKIAKDNISQVIGRIKSRTATLLSFNIDNQISGKHTWCKGFWFYELNNDIIENKAIQFVENLGH
jgi:hypothetical protein